MRGSRPNPVGIEELVIIQTAQRFMGTQERG